MEENNTAQPENNSEKEHLVSNQPVSVAEQPAQVTQSAENNSISEPSKKNKKLTIKTIVIGLLIVALTGLSIYFWTDARQARQSSPEGVAQKNVAETTEVIDSLGKILLLSADQEPTVARVENPDTLKQSNPDFYKDIQQGDYLVLYPQRAIVYRKDINQIINIAPIINASNLQNNTTENTGSEN